MAPPDDHLPAPPDLPSYTVEDADASADTRQQRARRPQRDVLERHLGTSLVRHDVVFDEDRIDPDAAKVVRRLERSGFQAYLVGGCVRDLLLGGKPKDFDVATNARPEDVRGLFRNCRVIGRRFRLAHILFGGGKVIEVATFRRNPAMEAPEEESSEVFDDLLIRSDNVFGEAHEDALRRDFTMNALFYDLDRRQVLDWCGGMHDVRRRTIHTIGDPMVRFREDPIRILRAIKFAARLDLGIAPDVYDAMVATRDDLAKAARPRLFEELLRLLRGGAAHRSMWLAWETGAMAVLLPELAAFLDDEEATLGGAQRFFRAMDAVDAMTRARGRQLDDVVLWTVLLKEPLDEACAGERDRLRCAAEFLEPVIERVAVPRRIADGVRRIIAALPRLVAGRPGRFARTELMGPALDVLEAELAASGRETDVVDKMRALAVTTSGRGASARPSSVHRDVRGHREPRERRGV
ncbi:MAG TPA: polynucleotide adenylyltransferase PcnB [Polyangiaceae bacterium]|nr:polynucleotide adenylyltransferase PcnB [Polyangiaceae bacterium]